MDLAVDLSDRSERSGALYRALRDAVCQGRIVAGERLPPSRVLAADLGVSRTTVTTAYERLRAEGFLEARHGAGTFVSAVAREPARARAGALRPRRSWHWRLQPVSGEQPVPAYDFRTGIPDATVFPFDAWRRILTAESRMTRDRPGFYAPPAGLDRLREAIVRRLAYARGVRADPGDLLVTNGTQQALDVIARVMLEPGDVVAMEDPGYPAARELFRSHGATVVPVPVDADGLRVVDIPAGARLVYVTPSHQFPLGVPLTLARRRALLARAAAHDVAVVEDDYDSEFRFSQRPLEPLHTLDRDGRVIYVGTFSKSLLPTLRLGYLVAPPSLRDALLAARQLADGHGALHQQAALARFLDEGLFAAHVGAVSKLYAQRRRLLLDGLAALPVEPVVSAAGLHLAAYADGAGDVAARARREGIAVETLRTYAMGPVRDGLVFGYGAVVTSSIEPGLERLARLFGAAAR